MNTSFYVHPMALVETETIGDNTKIWAFAHILDNVSIGANCNIGDHCFIETGARIGSGVTIKNNNMLWDGITIEDGVFVGPGVIFTNDRHPRSPRLSVASERYQDSGWLVPTLIQYGASLGAGAIILPGITVGRYAMVGAGAVVTRDVPAHALVAGNPASVRNWVCQCGHRLQVKKADALCDSCGQQYLFDEEKQAIQE